MQTTPLNVDMFVDDLVDFAVGLPAADDFAFKLFQDSDSLPSSPTRSAEKPTPDASTTSSEDITFVEKTYYMINTCPNKLACWNATGTGFIVVDADKFAREVLPDYFKHRNFNSFVCELTLHGFRKTALSNKKLGLDCFEFRHPNFLRGKTELLAKVERRVVNGSPKNITPESPRDVSDEIAECEDNDEVGEAVDDLKFQITELQGEVQQTQQLFDKLLTSLLQTATPQLQPQPIVRQQPFMNCAPVNFNMYGMAPQTYGAFCDPMSMAMPMTAMGSMNPYAMGDFGMVAPVEDNLMDLFYQP